MPNKEDGETLSISTAGFDYESFRKRLVSFQRRRMMTHADLARICGTTAMTMSRITRGQVRPGLESAIKISRLIDEPLDGFVLEEYARTAETRKRQTAEHRKAAIKTRTQDNLREWGRNGAEVRRSAGIRPRGFTCEERGRSKAAPLSRVQPQGSQEPGRAGNVPAGNVPKMRAGIEALRQLEFSRPHSSNEGETGEIAR